jgi:hypothetical protein
MVDPKKTLAGMWGRGPVGLLLDVFQNFFHAISRH